MFLPVHYIELINACREAIQDYLLSKQPKKEDNNNCCKNKESRGIINKIAPAIVYTKQSNKIFYTDILSLSDNNNTDYLILLDFSANKDLKKWTPRDEDLNDFYNNNNHIYDWVTIWADVEWREIESAIWRYNKDLSGNDFPKNVLHYPFDTSSKPFSISDLSDET